MNIYLYIYYKYIQMICQYSCVEILYTNTYYKIMLIDLFLYYAMQLKCTCVLT